ncbi:MAG: nucleotidyltransferase family protein [Verrucomicrobia bacterium]|nr:nucleotidyltransferase family protein [Verrucomicrobiota bacterium]
MVLAAGQSRRMGTQKLLLPMAGRPLITGIVDEVLRSPVAEVFVVLGRDAPRVTQALAGRSVHLLTNPCTDGEMLSSVRCGLRALPPECAAALVVLGDQPGITAETISMLIQAFQTHSRGIVVPTHGGKRGHPLLLSMRYRDELLSQHDGTGVRGLLLAHPDDVMEVEVPASGVVEDMDTPEDYRRMSAVDLHGAKEVSTGARHGLIEPAGLKAKGDENSPARRSPTPPPTGRGT